MSIGVVGDPQPDKNDRGSGSLKDYKYDLIPRSRKIVIRLAWSNTHQDELAKIIEEGADDLETAISRRTIDEERVDAPMPVRLFTGRRVSGVVGMVPRGLEPAIEEAMTRLELASKQPRIPAAIVKTRTGYRVDVLMGLSPA